MKLNLHVHAVTVVQPRSLLSRAGLVVGACVGGYFLLHGIGLVLDHCGAHTYSRKKRATRVV